MNKFLDSFAIIITNLQSKCQTKPLNVDLPTIIIERLNFNDHETQPKIYQLHINQSASFSSVSLSQDTIGEASKAEKQFNSTGPPSQRDQRFKLT